LLELSNWPQAVTLIRLTVVNSGRLLPMLALPLLYWLLPRGRLRPVLVVVGSIAFIYVMLEPCASWALPLIGILVYAASGHTVTRVRAILITAGLLGLYAWIISGAAGRLLIGLPPEWGATLKVVFGRTSLVMGNKAIWMIFVPIRMVSYVWDLYAGRTKRRGVADYLAWVTFFPMVPNAPFLWHEPFMAQLAEQRRPQAGEVLKGLRRLVTGLVLVLLANLGNPLLPHVRLIMPLGYSPLEVWQAAVGRLLQFFLNLCGWADINIGWASLFGWRLPENMRHPLRQTSLLEFWRRWNVMVSEFLKLYVYIPLGGSRRGPARTYLNYLVTMVLCGLWHGCNGPLAVWGAVQGVALALNRWWHARGSALQKAPTLVVRGLGWMLTLGFVTISFTLLFSGWAEQPLSVALQVIIRMLALR